jgi:uncharacterized membrane protein
MSATDVLASDAPPTKDSPSYRLESVDLLRGLVMVLMVLDHTRDFFGFATINPTDLRVTNVALFFTRWVTHFCAPVFMLLAGIGAYLTGTRRRTRAELARFLVVRGLWLLFLEFTLVRLGLTFSLKFDFVPLLVFWSIGMSMIVLAGLIFLPRVWIAAIGLVMIVGHNALDGIAPEKFGAYGWIWTVLHVQGPLPSPQGMVVFVVYPLIPWIGVMACGYALGPVFACAPERRRRILAALGLGLTAAFLVLRYANRYGDPQPWSVQKDSTFTALSFLNCNKYPPSLLYLLMTLGPALVFLSVAEHFRGAWTKPLLTFGRVPLFFFVLQWPLLHAGSIAVAWAVGQPYVWLIGQGPFSAPPGFGHDLPFTYAAWALALVLLYPPCAWFADLKRRRRDVWLSYL